MVKVWVFKDYVDAGGTNVVQAWYTGLSKRARAKINLTIGNYLEVTEVWDPRYAKMLKTPACKDLIEIRVFADNVQHRPLCFKGPGRREVTILVGAIEKGGKLVPASACETARKRMQSLTSSPGGGSVCDHQE